MISAFIEYSIIKETSNLLSSFISLIKLQFKHISILHFANWQISEMLELNKRAAMYIGRPFSILIKLKTQNAIQKKERVLTNLV